MATTFSGVIESFIKPEALAEFDKLGTKLDASLEGFDKVIAKIATLNTELQKGAPQFTQYVTASKQIADVNKQLADTQKQANATINDYNKQLKTTIETIKENTGANDDQARRIIALRTELNKTKDAVAVYQKLIREVNKENPASLSEKTFNQVFDAFGSETANSIKAAFDALDNTSKPEFIQQLTDDAAQFLEIQKQLEQELKDLSIAFRLQTKDVQAADGSIDQLGARLENLQKAYRALSQADREGEIGQGLKKQIDELDPQVKALEKNIGITRRLVGDYAGQLSPAFNTLKQRLEEVNNALKGQVQLTGKLKDLTGSSPIGFRTGGNSGTPSGQAVLDTVNAVKQLATEQQLLNKLIESGAVATGDLTQSNKELQRTIIGFKQANLEGSESYKLIQDEFVKGKKALTDLRDETKALASDTRALDQVIGIAGSLVAAYQTGAAAMQLFGDETEDSQRAIARLVAVQSVLNGLQNIQQQLTQKGTALNRLYAFAQNQVAIATDRTAASSVRLRAALITTGIGALVVAVGFLVNKMIELSSNTDNAAKSLENLQTNLQNVADETARLNSFIEQNTQLEVARLKSIGAGEQDVFDAQQEGLKKRRENLNTSLELINEERRLFEEQNKVTKQRNLPGGGTSFETVLNDTEEFRKGLNDIKQRYNQTEQQIDQINTQLQVNKFQFDEAQRNKQLAAAKKYQDEIKQLTEKEARAQLELFKFRKELQIKEDEQTASGGINDLNSRIAARERIAEAQKAIIVAEYNFAIRYGQLTTSGLTLEAEKLAAKEKEITENLLRDIFNIRKEYAERFNESDNGINNLFFDENSAEQQITKAVQAFERRKNLLERNAFEELRQLENARSQGIVTEEKYNLRRTTIEAKLAKDILQSELDLAEKKLAVLKASGVDVVEAEKEVARLRLEIAKATSKALEGTDNAKSGNDPVQDQIDKVSELRDKYFELGQTLKDTVFAFLDRGFVQAKNALQDQIDLIEQRKAKEIEAINATTASNEDKANRIKILEATTQAQREQLERRQRQIDLERARFQRASQAAAIIGNTAQGVTAALASVPPNVPLSIIIGAIGALQLATLFATPLPKFLHGKENDYEGPAHVSEDGRPELRINKRTGEMSLTPAKPSIMWVKKDDRIIPHNRIGEYMHKNSITSLPAFTQSNSTQQGSYQFTDANIVDAIKSKKMQQVVIIHNNTGWNDYVKTKIFK